MECRVKRCSADSTVLYFGSVSFGMRRASTCAHSIRVTKEANLVLDTIPATVSQIPSMIGYILVFENFLYETRRCDC